MTRRTVVFVSAFVFMFVALASSQPRMRPSPEDQAKTLRDSLALTEEQHDAITKILIESTKKISILMETAERGPEMRDAFMKIGEETDTKIMKVLDEDQQLKYKELRDEQRKALRERRRRR